MVLTDVLYPGDGSIEYDKRFSRSRWKIGLRSKSDIFTEFVGEPPACRKALDGPNPDAAELSEYFAHPTL